MSGRKKKKREQDRNVYRCLTLITQFGINMLVPICMMSALGIWLDRRFATSWCTVLLFFVGAVAGAQNIHRMAKSIYEPREEMKRSGPHGQAGDDTKENP